MLFQRIRTEQVRWTKKTSVTMNLVKYHAPQHWNFLSPFKLSKICTERAYGSTMFNFQTPLLALQRNAIVSKFILESNKQKQLIQTTSDLR